MKNPTPEFKSKVVLKGPKNISSNRSIPLPESLLPKLKKHRLSIIEEKLSVGESYLDNNLVFPTKKGDYVTSQGLQSAWKTILKNAKVDYINFHAIRHSYATSLLEKGGNINQRTICQL